MTGLWLDKYSQGTKAYKRKDKYNPGIKDYKRKDKYNQGTKDYKSKDYCNQWTKIIKDFIKETSNKSRTLKERLTNIIREWRKDRQIYQNQDDQSN